MRGFEPLRVLPLLDFETSALDRSATLPDGTEHGDNALGSGFRSLPGSLGGTAGGDSCLPTVPVLDGYTSPRTNDEISCGTDASNPVTSSCPASFGSATV